MLPSTAQVDADDSAALARRVRGLPSRTALLLLRNLLLLAAAVLFLLHFVHLAADFPNHSAWMDWAKYTDEGWYGDAAIRYFLQGHWYVPGDFNPAAALPVWPLLEAAVFRFSGVSLVAARALTVSIFGLILVLAYALLSRAVSWRRFHSGSVAAGSIQPSLHSQPGPSLAPATAVLLLAASPFCFAFMRLAILEPPLILLTLAALFAAATLEPSSPRWRRRTLPALAVGLLLPAMVLIKTTGLFLAPALAWMLFARCGYRLRSLLRPALLASVTALALWLTYFFLFVRPHFLTDYRYLFSANGYTGITFNTAASVLWTTLGDGTWIGTPIYLLALASVVLVAFARRLRSDPLAVSLVLWALGYAAFLAYHNNLQPRYYLVIAVPLLMLVPLVTDLLWRAPVRLPARAAATLLTLALAIIVVRDTLQTLRFVRHPEYTFVQAAGALARVVNADPTHSHLLMSISGSDLTLITGLPSLCDDFGTIELADRLKLYRPGWYASWNQIDDDKMDALTPEFHVERVAAFPAFDDPERNLLILYRLDPATTPRHPGRRHPRRPIPRRLVTRVGQQPSTTQLQH